LECKWLCPNAVFVVPLSNKRCVLLLLVVVPDYLILF